MTKISLNIILMISLFFMYSCKFEKNKHDNTTNNNEILEKLIYKANRYYQLGRYTKAKLHYNQIIKIDSTDGKSYYSRAYCRAIEEQYKKSNNDYFKSLSLEYKIEESYFNLGCNYASMKLDTQAIKYFKKAFFLNPNNKEAEFQIQILNKKLQSIDL